jgi:hypothetical protein
MATAWMDTLWDGEHRLLRDPSGETACMVRETVWYAVGLLVRGADGDRERAVQAVEAVLTHQYEAPGRPYHGSWRRTPEEPEPPADAVEWDDYDPNWREFIGCALLLILHEFAVPAALIGRIDRALLLAADGARVRAVAPSYTNIALMGSFLLDAVGHRSGRPELRRAGVDLAQRTRICGFVEFNSPTYYGVDLFALALWRSYAPSAVLQRLGAELERELWLEIARRYHPGLRNLAGPFDRTYGMDMRRYLALTGLWIGLVAGAEPAPVPAGGPARSAHAADWCFAPCFALLGAAPPAEITERLLAFPGESYVTTTIVPGRVATSWLGPRHMVGGQSGGVHHAGEQYCPVAVHWLAGNEVHWLRAANPIDAVVDVDGTLHVYGSPLRLEAYAPGPVRLDGAEWRLPGLTVRADAEATAERSGDLLRIECVAGSGRVSLTTIARS